MPCSKTKIHSDLPVASEAELIGDRHAAELRLGKYAARARDLYRGRQFLAMRDAVDGLREARRDLRVSLFIASAGYGLLEEDATVVPYEAALGTGRRRWEAKGRALGLPTAVRSVLPSLDFAVIALSDAYLVAAGLPLDVPVSTHLVYLASQALHPPEWAMTVRAGRAEARSLGLSERQVRGVILANLLARVAVKGVQVLDSEGVHSFQPELTP